MKAVNKQSPQQSHITVYKHTVTAHKQRLMLCVQLKGAPSEKKEVTEH